MEDFIWKNNLKNSRNIIPRKIDVVHASSNNVDLFSKTLLDNYRIFNCFRLNEIE